MPGQSFGIAIEKFSGDIMNYLEFKRNFAKYVENVYRDCDVCLTYLESLFVGEAHRAIKGMILHPNREYAYRTAWERLDQRFGDYNRLMQRVRDDLLEGPAIKEWDVSALTALCDKSLFLRLPYKLKSEFVALGRRYNNQGTFQDLRILVDTAVHDAQSSYGQLLYHSRNPKTQSDRVTNFGRGKQVRNASVSATVNSNSNLFSVCKCCKKSHRLWKCEVFLGYSYTDRFKFVKHEKLCFNCLVHGHQAKDCQMSLRCKTCKGKHHSLLHSDIKNPLREEMHVSEDPSETNAVSNVSACSTYKSINSGQQLHKVVPIKVWHSDPNQCVSTWAFMDEGSEIFLCTHDFAQKLGARLSQTKVNIATNSGASQVTKKIDQFFIQGVDEMQSFEVRDVLVQDSIVDVNSSIPTDELAKLYPHLEDLPFLKLESSKVELLLGQNVQNDFCISELRYGKETEPRGIHLQLGWALWGNSHLSTARACDTRSVLVNFVRADPAGDLCKETLKVLEQDFADTALPQETMMSKEDKRATAIYERSVTKENEHYIIALPWKESNPNLPESKKMAERRLDSLKKRLLADDELCKLYCEKMNDYVGSGYASRVCEEDIADEEGREWYVPHHCTSLAVKFRIVSDCSAKSNDVSLNDKLFQGPTNYLTNSLLGVLLRFRQEQIAIVGDIKNMFYQVFVDRADRDAFRFLWFPDGDLSQQPVSHRMNVHIFGCTSSPSVAAFALRKTALDNEAEVSAEAVSFVNHDFYVDDMCTSVSKLM